MADLSALGRRQFRRHQEFFHLAVLLVAMRVQNQVQRPLGMPLDFFRPQRREGFSNVPVNLGGHAGVERNITFSSFLQFTPTPILSTGMAGRK